ncbi:UPF0496 protein At4g34320-like [Telopea speciosissima]|uniref:UPF0496 protein At4g34320-like n=1 Tax=Telopea speciosissima TaxID=54955 RepID=UPI001CC7E103|nr:UPF0496 protein At4g34320-like [Telopea speciosissima]
MGGQFSRTGVPALQLDSDLHNTTEMSSNEAEAFRLDHPTLQSSDSTLQVGRNPVINTIASGVELRALSFDSLEEVTGSPVVMNPEVVQCILEKVKWKNKKLFQLVKDYFDNSLKTLNSFTALNECLRKVRDSQKVLHFALQQFEKEEIMLVDGKKYLATVLEEALKNFKAAGNPFTEDFSKDFLTVYTHQVLMLEKLQTRKNIFDKKLEFMKTWRKVSSIIFAATVASTLICSVVAFAVAAPHVVAAVAAATSIPVGSVGTWFNSLWKGYENALKGQKELISSMHAGIYVATKDLEGIWVPVNCLSIEIQTLMQNADFTLGEGEEVKIIVEVIEKKLEVLLKKIEDLTEPADRCSQDIRRARKALLQRVSKHPNN